MPSQDVTNLIESLTRNLFGLKQELREIEGFIRDARLTATEENTIYPSEDYIAIAESLEQDAQILRTKIKLLEDKRSHLLQHHDTNEI